MVNLLSGAMKERTNHATGGQRQWGRRPPVHVSTLRRVRPQGNARAIVGRALPTSGARCIGAKKRPAGRAFLQWDA
ncbi:MAG: hypothetical protein V4704_09395 [Pseudomonadota bacterium]